MAPRTPFAVAALCLAGLGWSAWSPQSCPVPRPTLWAAIRDTLWPSQSHRDGDATWAHLDSTGLPGATATWCNPLQNDAAARAAGRAIYAQHCATCHGEHGGGDGPGAAQADPDPYAFTRPEFAGMREPPGLAVLYAVVTRGIDGTTMQAFGETLGPWERLAVLAYISELPGAEAMRASRDWADSLRSRRQAHYRPLPSRLPGNPHQHDGPFVGRDHAVRHAGWRAHQIPRRHVPCLVSHRHARPPAQD